MRFGLILLVLLVASCQSGSKSISTSGETHFLTLCSTGDPCGDGLTCLCHTCTRPCDDQSACSSFPGASCVDVQGLEGCADAPVPSLCGVECSRDADCSQYGEDQACTDGLCQPSGAPLTSADNTDSGVALDSGAGIPGDAAEDSGAVQGSALEIDASAGMDSGASVNADDDASSTVEAGMLQSPVSCEPSGVSSNEILFIGDSFFAATHEVTGFTEELARSAGLLPAGQRFRDNSRLINNALAWMGNGIEGQYTEAIDESPVRVVIMNGGGADALVGSCDTPDASCPVVQDAVMAAQDLLLKMSDDAVQDVVYVFYPDPQDDDGTKQKVDAMRPLLQQTCEAASLCHWIDLRPVFEGHYDQYIAGDGKNPTTQGAEATADAIWALMRRECIGQ